MPIPTLNRKFFLTFSLALAMIISGCVEDSPPTDSTASPASATATPTPTPNSSLISNGDFSDTSGGAWVLYANPAASPAPVANVTYGGSEAKIVITSGTKNNYDLQFKQAGIALKQNESYYFTFVARGDVALNIDADMLNDLDGTDTYMGKQTIAVTTDPQEFTVSFKMAKPDSNTGRLRFRIGANANSGKTLYISKVALYKGAPPPTPSPIPYPITTPDPTFKGPLAYLSGGKLAYTPYPNVGETNRDNRIPDYSWAGYRQGGVALPDLPVKVTVNPNAVPGADDKATIQAAIDQVSALTPDANGFRGAVLLTKGTYNVAGTLTIKANGVVLRGEGQGSDGTIVQETTLGSQPILIQLSPAGTVAINEDLSSKQSITDAYVGTGATSFNIANASGFAIGDKIYVRRTVNDFWLDDLMVRQYGWTLSQYSIPYERTIKAISGNNITIDIPLVDPIQTKYGSGAISKIAPTGRLEDSGVENMRLISKYDTANQYDEKHGYSAIKLIHAQNCWVKNITAKHWVYSAVELSQSFFNTIQDSANLDMVSQIRGGMRYAFNINSGSGNLFQRLYSRTGRHDAVTGSTVAGPNVFLDMYAEQTMADIGPHHRWGTGNLFDNIKAGQIRVQNREFSGSGHGWAGAQTMFWNTISAASQLGVNPVDSNKIEHSVQAAKGSMNYSVGNISDNQTGVGYYESAGTPQIPRSLYLQQLQDRLGSAAVQKVTTPEQRSGTLYDKLKAWAGEGSL